MLMIFNNWINTCIYFKSDTYSTKYFNIISINCSVWSEKTKSSIRPNNHYIVYHTMYIHIFLHSPLFIQYKLISRIIIHYIKSQITGTLFKSSTLIKLTQHSLYIFICYRLHSLYNSNARVKYSKIFFSFETFHKSIFKRMNKNILLCFHQ